MPRQISRTTYRRRERPRPKSKYRNQKTVYMGITFDSQKEAKRYEQLRHLEEAGEICRLERQVKYDLSAHGEHICFYYADFRYLTQTGQTVVEDTKGFRTKEYILKRKLMKSIYGIEILET